MIRVIYQVWLLFFLQVDQGKHTKYCMIQKINSSYSDIKEKKNLVSIYALPFPNAIVYPRAMVVEFSYTAIALLAMFHAFVLFNPAVGTDLVL